MGRKISALSVLSSTDAQTSAYIPIVDPSEPNEDDRNKRMTLIEVANTLNGGTWDLSRNYLATRSAGTLAPGGVQLIDYNNTFTGDAGGTTDVAGLRVLQTSIGSNTVSQSMAGRFTGQSLGSGSVTTLRGVYGETRVDGAGNVTGALGVSAGFELTSNGNVTTSVQMFRAAAPVISGSGTISAIYGLLVSNMGHANVTDSFGIRLEDHSSSVGSMFGIYTAMTAGSAKWAFYGAGTAKSHFGGKVLINQTTDDGSSQVQLTGTGSALKINATGNTYIDITDGTREVFAGIVSSIGVFGTISNHPVVISSNNLERIRVDTSGNIGIGTSSFGTNAAGVFGVATGTAPTTGPADTVQFYSSDNSAGNTIPSFYCEGTEVIATGQGDSASSVRVKMRINGTVVTLLAI